MLLAGLVVQGSPGGDDGAQALDVKQLRVARFLRGEDELMVAWVGVAPPRALREGGKPVALPEPDERRDGSGSPLPAPIIGIG